VSTRKTFVSYVRVSRVNGREGESFISPDEQSRKIRAWADMKGYELVELPPDLDESGGSQDRPSLREAIRMVEDHEVDGIVVAKLNRFARNVGGAMLDIEHIWKLGGSVVFVEEGFDATTSMGKAMLQIFLAFAELERNNAKQSWAETRANAHSRGVYLRPTPFGYDKHDGRLAVNLAEAAIVSRAYELVPAEGIYAAVKYFYGATGLTEDHDGKRPIRVVRRPDAKYLYENPAPVFLRRLLANLVYKGVYELNGVPREVPAIVDAFTWELAQTEATIKHAKPREYPLTGLMTCAQCGGQMIGTSAGTPRVQSYICRNHRRGDCSTRNGINQGAIHEHLLEILIENFGDGDQVLIGSDGDGVDLDALQRDIEKAEASRTAYALNTDLEAQLGPVAYAAGAKVRSEAVSAAQRTYREGANQSTKRVVRLPVDVIRDLRGEDLASILELAFGSIVIRDSLDADRHRVDFSDRVHFPDIEDQPALTAGDPGEPVQDSLASV
jgi:site-specific DNA recombinase